MVSTANNSQSIFALDGSACAQELEWESTLLEDTFRSTSSASKNVVNLRSSEDAFQRKQINGEAALEHLLSSPRVIDENNTSGRVRIFSVNSDFSNKPLNVTITGMQALLKGLDTNISFFHILSAFGQKPRRSEAGLDCFFSHCDSQEPGAFEVMYLLRFAEYVPEAEIGWTFRQIGVYHRHCTKENDDTFLLLQHCLDSQLEYNLEDLRGNALDVDLFRSAPLRLHQLILQTYFVTGWRGYLHNASRQFTLHSDMVFTEDLIKNEGVTYDTLRDWRDLADRTTPVPAMIDSLRRIIEGLQGLETYIGRSTLSSFLTAQMSLAQGLLSSALTLRTRIDGVIGLLANTIEMKNQHQAAVLNCHMQSLTKETVDDSANVKIVTVLSLVYLPASFLATLFGMDFFNFDGIRRRIQVSKDFWMFFAILIPLMVSTIGSWFVMYRRAKAKRRKRQAKFI